MWDYHFDKSYLIFYFEKKQQIVKSIESDIYVNFALLSFQIWIELSVTPRLHFHGY